MLMLNPTQIVTGHSSEQLITMKPQSKGSNSIVVFLRFQIGKSTLNFVSCFVSVYFYIVFRTLANINMFIIRIPEIYIS